MTEIRLKYNISNKYCQQFKMHKESWKFTKDLFLLGKYVVIKQAYISSAKQYLPSKSKTFVHFRDLLFIEIFHKYLLNLMFRYRMYTILWFRIYMYPHHNVRNV